MSGEQRPPPNVRAYRLIRPSEVKQRVGGEGGVRPKSSNYADHPADGMMSVYLEDEIAAAGANPVELLHKFPGYGLAYHLVSDLTTLGLDVVRAPNAVFPGHANVVGKKTAGIKSKLARSARWLEGVQPPPPS